MTNEVRIFRDTDFTLTAASVVESRFMAEKDIADDAEALGNPNEDERVVRIARQWEERHKQIAALYGEHDDEAILGIARTIFDKGRTLELSGASNEDIVDTVYAEVPEADLLYSLMRMSGWGYRLGQTRMAIRVQRLEQASHKS